jgi:hypothetical protein
MTGVRKLTLLLLVAGVAGSALVPGEASAQRRSARPRSVRSVVVPVYASPFYYRPYYASPFFFSGYWGWGPWYPYGYPSLYYGAPYDYTSTARLLVKPEEAEVYVDGYMAGTVDDFDGVFQGLRLRPGGHDIELYLDGHRTFRQKIYLSPGSTHKIRHTMVPLQPGEQAEPKPVPTKPPTSDPRPRGYDRSEGTPEGERDVGTLAIRVQPAGAEVLIDGERWLLPEGEDRLEVQVAEGGHLIEVRKAGYRTFSSRARVEAGKTSRLNVSLSSEQQR